MLIYFFNVAFKQRDSAKMRSDKQNSWSTEILISSVSLYSSVLCSPLMSDSWKAKNTHTQIGKRKGNQCIGSAKRFCSVYPILYFSYLYYVTEVWFLAALHIICISALWYKRLPHWLGSFYIFLAFVFLWHTYLCKMQGFGGSSPCSSSFITTR